MSSGESCSPYVIFHEPSKISEWNFLDIIFLFDRDTWSLITFSLGFTLSEMKFGWRKS